MLLQQEDDIIDSSLSSGQCDKQKNTTKQSNIENELFQVILTDNKKITKELRTQLDTIEQLQTENETLKTKLNKIFQESELCLNRDELHLKRNVALSRENKMLKDKIGQMTKQIQESTTKFQLEKEQMSQSFGEEREHLLYQHDKLHMNSIRLQTQLNQQKKECKWFNSENKRLERLLNKKRLPDE